MFSAFCLSSMNPLIEQYSYGKLARDANITFVSRDNSCNINTSDPLFKEQQRIQSETSDIIMKMTFVNSGPNFVMVPIFLFLSDCFGRKAILLYTLAVYFFAYTAWACVVFFDLNVYRGWS